jgi:integral membrane protein (TIGR01906 family)
VSSDGGPAGPNVAAPGRPVIALASGMSTAVVLVALAILPFLTPLWIFSTQERAEADAWTGWPIETVHAVTAEVLVDMVVGPPDFDQEVDGVPVFDERERGHLRDVRTVFIGFALLAAVAAAVLVTAWWLGRGGTAAWRGARSGAKVLAVAVVALGIVSVVAFDTVFEVFHTLLFPGGSYTFDPSTERLVQLFPYEFWFQTAIALGVLIVALAIATVALATRRIRRAEATMAAASALATGPAAP